MTLRQLVWMADGRMRHDWQIGSNQMALTANIHRSSGSRTYSAADFNPCAPPTKAVGIDILKQVFVNRRNES
jgi:hypothetical protein